MRYQSAPRNIYRHIILSEMKEAMAALPLVRGPDGAQAVVPLSAARWHSPPCRACRRRARLQPQPPARNIRLTSKRPPWGGTRGHVWAGRAGVGAQLRCPPQDYGLSSWSDRLCAWGSAAGDAAFTPSFFSLLQEVTSQPVMGFDPLPPLDSIVSYTRPERYLLHPSFLRWHSRRVPGAPSTPGLGALGARSRPPPPPSGRKSSLACGAHQQQSGQAGLALPLCLGGHCWRRRLGKGRWKGLAAELSWVGVNAG